MSSVENNRHYKYNLNVKKVSAAMKEVGADENTDLRPNYKNGPAADIANKLGMNGDNLNVRRGIDRFVKRKVLSRE